MRQIHFVINHLRRQALAQQDPAAIDEAARLGKFGVPGHEILVRNAVAIEKNQVIATRLARCQVARLRGGKADIRMPDMTHRTPEGRAALMKHLDLIGPRAVVGNQDFMARITLLGQGAQYWQQGIRAVVGQDDEADLL